MKKLINFIFLLFFSSSLFSQSINNIRNTPGKLVGGIDNDEYIKIKYNHKNIDLIVSHSFFNNKLNSQKFDITSSLKLTEYSIFRVSINTSLYGNYNDTRDFKYYFSPFLTATFKIFEVNSSFDFDSKINFDRFNINLYIKINEELKFNTYIQQSLQSYYSDQKRKNYGINLQYKESKITAIGGFEIPQEYNKKFIRFKLGVLINIINCDSN